MKIVHTTKISSDKRRVVAANVFEDEPGFEGPNLENDSDGVEDTIEDEDMGEDGQQDGSTIDIDNNIFDHLIAECQNCHGIFISAMIGSDQPVESINGVCPLCSKETEQFFVGIIKKYPEEE